MSLLAVLAAGCRIAEPSLHASPPVVYYVAPGGSDQNSGKLNAPFATLGHARDVVRGLKRNGAPITIYLRGGTYTLAAPLHFQPEDSGTAEAQVTYAAYKDEHPLISGGKKIEGWKPVNVDGKLLWAVQIPDVRDGKWYFRQLFVNGRRAMRARTPNTGFFRATAIPGLDLKKPYHLGNQSFQYAPGQLANWPDLDDAEVVFLTFWISARQKIAAIDETTRTVKLALTSPMRLTDGFGRTPQLARFYIDNAFELLDAPGEWYLNRKTGTLYYLPMPGEQIGRTEAIAPVLEQLMFFDGQAKDGRPVEYVNFRGVTFAHAEWWVPNNVMYNTSTGGFGQNYGRQNVIRNNIFAFGKQAQIEHAGNMEKAPPGSSYTLERNIFYYRSSENLLRGPWQPRPGDQFTIDHNLYWREGGGELKFGNRTLKDWRMLGFDKKSFVVDPLFVNAAARDFRLKPGSPAGKIGFQTVDLSTVGPRK